MTLKVIFPFKIPKIRDEPLLRSLLILKDERRKVSLFPVCFVHFKAFSTYQLHPSFNINPLLPLFALVVTAPTVSKPGVKRA